MLKRHNILLWFLLLGVPAYSRSGPQLPFGPGGGSARSLYDQIVKKINQVRKLFNNQTQIYNLRVIQQKIASRHKAGRVPNISPSHSFSQLLPLKIR